MKGLLDGPKRNNLMPLLYTKEATSLINKLQRSVLTDTNASLTDSELELWNNIFVLNTTEVPTMSRLRSWFYQFVPRSIVEKIEGISAGLIDLHEVRQDILSQSPIDLYAEPKDQIYHLSEAITKAKQADKKTQTEQFTQALESAQEFLVAISRNRELRQKGFIVIKSLVENLSRTETQIALLNDAFNHLSREGDFDTNKNQFLEWQGASLEELSYWQIRLKLLRPAVRQMNWIK